MCLVEHDSDLLYSSNHTAAFVSIKHINNGTLSASSNTHSLLEPKNNVKTRLLSVRCHSFLNVKLFPVLRSSPFPRLANVQNWYFIFLDRLL